MMPSLSAKIFIASKNKVLPIGVYVQAAALGECCERRILEGRPVRQQNDRESRRIQPFLGQCQPGLVASIEIEPSERNLIAPQEVLDGMGIASPLVTDYPQGLIGLRVLGLPVE